MARYMTITFDLRGVSCTAKLLDDEAPRTASAVWDALPLSGQAFHGKYARNEVYNLVPAFADPDPGSENTTVTPIPGDVCYFAFTSNQLATPSHGYASDAGPGENPMVTDLAVFYGRNNLLLNGDQGWVPGNVYAQVVEGFEEFAAACHDVWFGGVRGETLTYARLRED